MRTHLLWTLLLPLPLLPLPAAAAEEEWMRDVPNLFEDSQYTAEAENYRYFVVRVVDDAMYAPIPGARLFAQYEIDHALPRLARPGRVAVAGEDGWVRYLLRPYEGNWYYVDAPGYGPFAEMGLPDEVRLRRGVDLAVTLKDALGRPVAGAYIGYYLGCGHTPDSRQARTDKAGRAVIPCIDPDEGILFPVAAGIEARDWYLPNLEVRDGRVEIVAPPGYVVEGQVLDEQGQPLAGALVHGSGWNHGPRAETDAEGRFRLEGVSDFAWITVARDGESVAGFRSPPPGVRRVFRLPRQTKVDTFEVPVAVTDAVTGGLDERVAVYAVRSSDGLTVRKQTNATGVAYLSLPAGRYTLVVGDELGTYRSVRHAITVARNLGKPLHFALQRQPLLRVDASAVPRDWTIVLSSARSEVEVDEEARAGAVPAPEGLPLVLRLQAGPGVCGGIVELPLAGRGGDRRVLVIPKPARSPPAEERGLPAAKPVEVLFPDGSPAAGASVHCRRRNAVYAGVANDEGVAVVGLSGGDVTVDAGDEWLTLSTRLKGDGPWTLRLGSCAVELDVRGADGKPLEPDLFTIDGEAFSFGPEARVRGLAPGAHRILVAAGGYLAKDCRVVLKKGETRKLEVQLRRPPR